MTSLAILFNITWLVVTGVKPTPEEEIISAWKQNLGNSMEDDSNSKEEEEEYKEEEGQLASSVEEEVVEQYSYSEESEVDD